MILREGKQKRPRRVLLYGPHGTGKSTWAACAPNHVFLSFEGGLNDIDCRSTDRIKSFSELLTILMELSKEPKELDWIVFDTLDWLETLVHDVIRGDAESIADIPYGNGYKQALGKWQQVIKALDYLIEARNCGVIAIAHSDIKKFSPPDGDSFDRYGPALHPLASLLWQEWVDECFHLNFRVYTRKEESGFGQERGIGFGDSERYIRTQESPAVLAKSRLKLPAEIPCDWKIYEQAIIDNHPTTKPKKVNK